LLQLVIGEPIKNILQVFNRSFTILKKFVFGCAGPLCSTGP